MKNIIWKLWLGDILLEELRGDNYVANIKQMRKYVKALKDNWKSVQRKSQMRLYITEEEV